MTTRAIILSTLLLACSAPAFAQQDDVQGLRKQIEELRRHLAESDDRMLEMARKYDQNLKRLQDEKEQLLQEVTSLKRENALLKAKGGDAKAGKKKEDAVLDERTLTLNFLETPLSEVAMFLRDISGLNLVLKKSVPEDAQVSLELQNKTIRQAMDALCKDATTGDGEPLPLEWRFKKGVIEITRGKK